jgi:hypothetical protein
MCVCVCVCVRACVCVCVKILQNKLRSTKVMSWGKVMVEWMLSLRGEVGAGLVRDVALYEHPSHSCSQHSVLQYLVHCVYEYYCVGGHVLVKVYNIDDHAHPNPTELSLACR